ncbi:conserved Plasmodium protein, unknown function [Plasmodium malariae]|uniref:Uncharacterized protein n=1 Tax=Plasmodium malariae TaxID=5858 RepID=A0A1C3L2F0_PLAMA|nr:conserved Plasmodium protein, unknown function [Plasmodium malariae]
MKKKNFVDNFGDDAELWSKSEKCERNNVINALNNINTCMNEIDDMINNLNANIGKNSILDDEESYPGDISILKRTSSKSEDDEGEEMTSCRSLANTIESSEVEEIEEDIIEEHRVEMEHRKRNDKAYNSNIQCRILSCEDKIDTMSNKSLKSNHSEVHNRKYHGDNLNIITSNNVHIIHENFTSDVVTKDMHADINDGINNLINNDLYNDLDNNPNDNINHAGFHQGTSINMKNTNNGTAIAEQNCDKNITNKENIRCNNTEERDKNVNQNAIETSTKQDDKESSITTSTDKNKGNVQNEKEKKKGKWRNIFSSKKMKKKNFVDNFGDDAELWSKSEKCESGQNGETGPNCENYKSNSSSKKGDENFYNTINTSSNNMHIERGELDVITNPINSEDVSNAYNRLGNVSNNSYCVEQKLLHTTSSDEKRECFQTNAYNISQGMYLSHGNPNVVGDELCKDQHNKENHMNISMNVNINSASINNNLNTFENYDFNMNNYHSGGGMNNLDVKNRYNSSKIDGNNIFSSSNNLDVSNSYNATRGINNRSSNNNSNGNINYNSNSSYIYESNNMYNNNAHNNNEGMGRNSINCSVYSYNPSNNNKKCFIPIDEHINDQENFLIKKKNSQKMFNYNNEGNNLNNNFIYMEQNENDMLMETAHIQFNNEKENCLNFRNNEINNGKGNDYNNNNYDDHNYNNNNYSNHVSSNYNYKVDNTMKFADEADNQYNLFYNMNNQNEDTNNNIVYLKNYDHVQQFNDASQSNCSNYNNKTANIKRVNSSATNTNKNVTTSNLSHNNKLKLSTKSEVHYNSYKSQKNKTKKNLEDLFA